jgi:hypothetical protein
MEPFAVLASPSVLNVMPALPAPPATPALQAILELLARHAILATMPHLQVPLPVQYVPQSVHNVPNVQAQLYVLPAR